MKLHSLYVALLAIALPLFAQEPAPTAPPPEKPVKRSLLKYTPPKDPAPGQRIDGDGGSRPGEPDSNLPKLYTLTPKTGVALTTRPQPTLFSFQEEKAKTFALFQLTINEPGRSTPLFVITTTHSAKGIHRLDLADYDVSLKPGVNYEWNVALKPDPKSGSKDRFASGFIKRIEPDAALAEKLKNATPADLPSIYAEAGIWYDALAALADQIAANPKDQDLLIQRAALLEQAGLEKIPATTAGR